jgi:hypothetical protein
MGIYGEIRDLLARRGWKIDPKGKEVTTGLMCGATKEFIHPESGVRLTWFDAILAEDLRNP